MADQDNFTVVTTGRDWLRQQIGETIISVNTALDESQQHADLGNLPMAIRRMGDAIIIAVDRLRSIAAGPQER